MSIIVEHEKRRKEILEKSLDVFINEGFENVTFQKIADCCGITRTTLYIYFKNKREIFKYSVKMFLEKTEEGIKQICSDTSLDSINKIIKVMYNIFQQLEENRNLLRLVMDYLLNITKNKTDPGLRIRRRTIKLQHILVSLIIEGIKKGELKDIKIKLVHDYLYNFIEAAVYRLVVLKQETTGNLRDTVVFAVNRLATGIA